MARGPPGPWSLSTAQGDQGDRQGTPYEQIHTREFGPLLHAWVTAAGRSVAEFWEAEPWEVAAVLGVAPYGVAGRAHPDGTPAGKRGQRLPSGGDGDYGHARSQRDLLRARIAHHNDPGRNPKPVALADGGSVVAAGLSRS